MGPPRQPQERRNLGRSAKTDSGPVRRSTSAGKQNGGPLLPPPMTTVDREALETSLLTHPLPLVSQQQQHEVSLWLSELGIVLRENEGGFIPCGPSDLRPLNMGRPAIPLKHDRLRNGVLLCDLFCIVERTAASQSGLTTYIHRSPVGYQEALDNVKRALWLFRLRRCPPIRSGEFLRVPCMLSFS